MVNDKFQKIVHRLLVISLILSISLALYFHDLNKRAQKFTQNNSVNIKDYTTARPVPKVTEEPITVNNDDYYTLLSFPSPSARYSLNIAIIGSFLDKPSYEIELFSPKLSRVEPILGGQEINQIFANLKLESGAGYGGMYQLEDFLHWNNDNEFVFLSDDTFYVFDISQQEVREFAPKLSGYKPIDADKRMQTFLFRKVEENGEYVYPYNDVILNQNTGEKVDVSFGDVQLIFGKYDTYSDGFVYYLLEYPKHLDTSLYFIDATTLEKSEVYVGYQPEEPFGRGCGGWHIVSNTHGILEIDDQCTINLISNYYNDKGYLEFDFR